MSSIPRDERPIDIAQISKLTRWLDEQRTQDKDLIAKLTVQVERLATELRDSQAQMTEVQDRLRQTQTALGRLPIVESALRQTRDQLGDLQSQLEELGQRESRDNLVSQTEVGRVAKSIAEITQQIDALDRRDDATLARLQMAVEEMKHDRTAAAALPQRLEHAEKNSVALIGRVQLLEELHRRGESQIVGLGQADEETKGELKRLVVWQQTAEVRWARQLADWQQQMEQWHRLLDDQARLIQDLAREWGQGRDSIEVLRRELAEQHKRLEVASNTLQHVENMQTAAGEEANRLLQAIDAQRRRIDEQFGSLRQIEETMRQQAAAADAISRRLDAERARIDEIAGSLRETAEVQHGDRSELEQLQKEVRALRFELQSETERALAALGDLRQGSQERLAEVVRLHERHNRRQIEELEQMARDLRGQDAVAGPTKS